MILENIIDKYLNSIINNNESIFPMDSPHMVVVKNDEDNNDMLDIDDIASILADLEGSP